MSLRPAARSAAPGLACVVAAGLAAAAVSCGVARPKVGPSPADPGPARASTRPSASAGEVAVPSGGRVVRVALALGAVAPEVTATAPWTVADADGRVLARAGAGERWTVEGRAGRTRARAEDGRDTPWVDGPLVARPEGAGFVRYAGKRYRGALWLHAAGGGGVTVVNRVPAEEYLRGVLPLELPTERPGDLAAVEAQAVAARSYLYTRVAEFMPRAAAVARAAAAYDVRATVEDQLYGGADAEQPTADRALLATAGLVLRYDGAVVSGPYHSACGGTTADPSEIWGAERAPYLTRVSDSVPGGGRAYCDLAPRARWERAWDAGALDATVARYLRRYAAAGAPGGGQPLGAVRAWEPGERTGSGRTGSVAVTTDAGRFVLRGNAIRFAMRAPGSADILPSTYFTAEAVQDGGRVTRLVLRGRGNGHGVGLCQWGAIGRARAGQDFRRILETYYPGTTVDAVD